MFIIMSLCRCMRCKYVSAIYWHNDWIAMLENFFINQLIKKGGLRYVTDVKENTWQCAQLY